jgi:hypothetical protein
MKSARVITGLCRVCANHDLRNANTNAGFTGITGFTGLYAHVCARRFMSMLSAINKRLSRARNNNYVNPVNPVTRLINQGFQRIRVGLEPCTTLIKVIRCDPVTGGAVGREKKEVE